MEIEGWQKLRRLAKGNGRHAYQALELIASYAYGKPSQPVTGPDGGPVQFAVTALIADITREVEKSLVARVSPFALDDGNLESAEPADSGGDVVYMVDPGGPGLGEDEDGG